MDRSKIAVFIDVENLTHWIKHGGPESLIAELGAKGQLIVRRAYGNWSNPCVQGFQGELNRLGFELIHNFHPVSKKNSSDIQLTIDVIEYALKLNDVDWFVLATGDSDFSPLFRRLREMGKDVIGVGPRSPLSESVKTSCSQYIHTDPDQPIGSKAQRSSLDDAKDIIERLLGSAGQQVPVGNLKLSMLNIDSAFNERALGYRSFIDLLTDHESVELIQDEKYKNWYATLKPATAQVAEDLADQPLVRRYEQLLRKTQWRQVSSQVLNIVHQTALRLRQANRELLELEVLTNSSEGLTKTEVKKAYNILHKAGVIFQVTDQASSERHWRIATEKPLERTVDCAMLARLIGTGSQDQVPLDHDVLRQFLHGTYETVAFNDLVESARQSARSAGQNHAA
ncbi:NYN domain-containing protein [Pseudomonas oryzihabitans]|uniref:HTH OST-type domain-containing protein n=1 Tax=Pseudomonas oryzihabitans TaxID=47885 RepID=A0AAJ2EX92_9PSED|nr:NYN domain-containing protein [Pseudomonas psychrotolerans]MDR6234236.1 hypothetical protein [Pseudomonas psychrotolerans]MDR6356651.1 hypothetical protein [Pseudomonas psychrotolerans]MDR6677063.1 hypothetical protein [Pseudomonas psychrotolerans]